MSLPSNVKWGSINFIPETPDFALTGQNESIELQNTKVDVVYKNDLPIHSTPKAMTNIPKTPNVDHIMNEETNLNNNDTTQQGLSTSHIKMRPVHYDRTDDWDEYISQFEIMSDINKWECHDKGLYLASNRKG